jgi:putative FmdB family regulatory protein
MPIYEFACPRCRKIFSFLSKRLNPGHLPVCPKCGGRRMQKQESAFAMPRGLNEPGPGNTGEDHSGAMPDIDDPRVVRAMDEIERDMASMDENNPKQMAHVMKKMKDILPPNTVPQELDMAIKRLEAGESPEKIEEEMGDVLGGALGEPTEGQGSASTPAYGKDPGLYDYT